MSNDKYILDRICLLYEIFTKAETTDGQFQNFIESEDLIISMLKCPDLASIDRVAFNSLLCQQKTTEKLPQEVGLTCLQVPPFKSTPISKYVDRIMARNKKRNWGFTPTEAKSLALKLVNHKAPLEPTGVNIWLGGNFDFNFEEAVSWISDELDLLTPSPEDGMGYIFEDNLYGEIIESYCNIVQPADKRKLNVTQIDFAPFWEQNGGIFPNLIRDKKENWPGLELLWYFALNPHVLIAIGKKFHVIFLLGVTKQSNNAGSANKSLIYIRFDKDSATKKIVASINSDDSASSRWSNATTADFCSKLE